MNHIIIRDPLLQGWEYGMLRSFEKAVQEETGARVVDIPAYGFAPKYQRHFGHGMKRAVYRKYFPKQEFSLKADVAWYILMGPENYRLDLYKNWVDSSGTKILYLFDTLPAQYPLIKKLLSNQNWDLLITSFNDAVPDLERITGRKWICIEQAADRDLFKPVPMNERGIHFSSYGRRFPRMHKALLSFCGKKDLYYDFTTHDGKHPTADPADLYRQYAWHLSHSLFTLSWPVELTNPLRAGHLHPVTCRWFEAAMAGTAIMGRKPDNLAFDQWLGKDLVIDMDPEAGEDVIEQKLEWAWNHREQIYAQMTDQWKSRSKEWTWNERVQRIVSMLQNSTH